MTVQNTTFLLKYLTEQQYSNVFFIGEGWSSVAFQADDFIIRFPKHGLKDYIKEQEICNLLRNKMDILLPESQVCSGKITYVKHQKIYGHSWNQTTINNLSTKELSLLSKDIANFFYTIHINNTEYKAPTFKPVKASDINSSFSGYIDDRLLQEMLDMYINTKVPAAKKTTLIHGDFSYKNSVLDKNHRLIGVFDWCNSGMGDKTFDFVNLYALFPNDFIHGIIDKYQELSGEKFDIEHLKKLYFLRNIYLLYWAHRKSKLTSEVLSYKVTEILHKVSR